MFEVLFSSKAEKYLKKNKEPKLKEALKKAIIQISKDPYIGATKKGDLSGFYGYDIYYSKTQYEIAYTIGENPKKLVVVVLVGTREQFYEQLKRSIR